MFEVPVLYIYGHKISSIGSIFVNFLACILYNKVKGIRKMLEKVIKTQTMDAYIVIYTYTPNIAYSRRNQQSTSFLFFCLGDEILIINFFREQEVFCRNNMLHCTFVIKIVCCGGVSCSNSYSYLQFYSTVICS